MGELVQQNAKETRTVIRTVQKWQRPAQNFLKINCDASFRRETGDGGWGFIIRDEDGDMISAGRGRLSHILDPFQAEVVACLQALQAAIDLGISRVHLETDAVQVQQAVESQRWDLSMAGGLIREIKELVSLNCVEIKIRAVPRSCNRVAHDLAALGCVCSVDDDPIMAHPPDCILNIVAAERVDTE